MCCIIIIYDVLWYTMHNSEGIYGREKTNLGTKLV